MPPAPLALGIVNRRFSTPVTATVVIGLILIAATWAYLLSGPVANLFLQLIDVTGLLFASYYILTALATIVFYRRRVASNPWDALMAGLLPFCAALPLDRVEVGRPRARLQRWSLVGDARSFKRAANARRPGHAEITVLRHTAGSAYQ
jgi:hypothetical protein